MTAVEFRAAMAAPVPTAKVLDSSMSAADRMARMDLSPYMNRYVASRAASHAYTSWVLTSDGLCFGSSPFSVHTEFHSLYAFRLFRSMGLRHLPIVNDDNEVMGMITRKDLIEPMIKARYEHMLEQHAILNDVNATPAGVDRRVLTDDPHTPRFGSSAMYDSK